MKDLQDVLGGGETAATPKYHDFMHDVELNFITSDADVDIMLEEFEQKLKFHTQMDPMLLSVDVETAAVMSLLDKYRAEQETYNKIREEFEKFPVIAKLTAQQKADRQSVKDRMDDARSILNDIARHVKRAGLNVGTGQVRLLQIYDGMGAVHVVDRWAVTLRKFDEIGKRLLNLYNVVWLAHNAQFDVKMLTQHGIIPFRHPHCTLLQAQALVSLTTERKTLAERCRVVLDKEPSKEQQASDWSKPDLDTEQVRYAAGDVVATWLLHEAQLALVKDSKRTPYEECEWVYNLMRSSIRAVNEVMSNGIGFDRVAHDKLCVDMADRDTEGRQKSLELFSSCGADGAPIVENPASTTQVANWLRYHLMLREPYTTDNWPKTDTGQLKVGKVEVLENITQLVEEFRPPLMALAEWADAKKNNSTLGEKFSRFVNPVSQRRHANFRIGGTETGRFSVTEPALQTINATPEFRHLFKAKEHHSLVVCDYGQIEVRVPAALSKDKVLLDAIEDGLDIHTLTARHCFKGDYPNETGDDYFKAGEGKWMRQAAKACIFGLLFGQGPRGLAQVLTTNGHPTTVHEAGRIQHEVLDLYTGLRDWIRKTRERADRSGFLWTPQGRVYAPFKSTQLFTKSINTPCQGGAAEIMLLALSKFPKIWGDIPAYLVHVVHDELIAEVPDEHAEETLALMLETMRWAATSLFENIPQRGLVEGDIGKTWGEAK